MSCICEVVDRQLALRSPFGRLVATNYYDGPVAGILECDLCKKLYYFENLDWDEGQDLRVYSVALIPGRAFQELNHFLSSSLSRREWVLSGADDDALIRIVDGM